MKRAVVSLFSVLCLSAIALAGGSGPVCKRYPSSPSANKLGVFQIKLQEVWETLQAEGDPVRSDLEACERRHLLEKAFLCAFRAIQQKRVRIYSRLPARGRTSRAGKTKTGLCATDCIVIKTSVFCGPADSFTQGPSDLGLGTFIHEAHHQSMDSPSSTGTCAKEYNQWEQFTDEISADTTQLLMAALINDSETGVSLEDQQGYIEVLCRRKRLRCDELNKRQAKYAKCLEEAGISESDIEANLEGMEDFVDSLKCRFDDMKSRYGRLTDSEDD